MSHSHSSRSPVHPPAPFVDDFHFFNPALQGPLPSPPPLSSSSDLFSASETTDFLGFLDNIAWDFQVDSPHHASQSPPIQYANAQSISSESSSQMMLYTLPPRDELPHDDIDDGKRETPSYNANASSASASASPPPTGEASSSTSSRKPLLSTPQKRLNHIMSEQKRRNAIRDGYVQLTTLLAPVGAPPGIGMPTRGRPKGSGSRGRGTKGKSGILFRAREYIQWLEEGNLALSQEVLRVEAAAGLRS